MTASTAQLSDYRQSPRKVRLVADLIRGKSVDRALALLSTLPKRASDPMAKLLKSAVASSKQEASALYVSKIEVNGGMIFRRQMPRARGRGAPIKKKTSVITLALSAKPAKK